MISQINTHFQCDQILHTFNRAASTFSGYDFLYREMARRMEERLHMIRLKPNYMLDAGCALGADYATLTKHYPEAVWLGVDQSFFMLKEGKRIDRKIVSDLSRLLKSFLTRTWLHPPSRIVARVNSLPFLSEKIDFIWSNAVLHWITNLSQTFKEFNRVLCVNGLLMFSLLGPDTLKELRFAIQTTGYSASEYIHDFLDMHDVGDNLISSKFQDPVIDREILRLTYKDPWAALYELKRAGSSAVHKEKTPGLTTRRFWSRVIDHWPRTEAGRYILTFELIQGHAWKLKSLVDKKHSFSKINVISRANHF